MRRRCAAIFATIIAKRKAAGKKRSFGCVPLPMWRYRPRAKLHELKIDLKHGLRVYRRRSLSAVLAVAALGLAIGASTGVFSVLNALLLRNLPSPNRRS